MWTGMIALVRSVILRRTSSGSIMRLASMSTVTGTAPAPSTDAGLATNV